MTQTANKLAILDLRVRPWESHPLDFNRVTEGALYINVSEPELLDIFKKELEKRGYVVDTWKK